MAMVSTSFTFSPIRKLFSLPSLSPFISSSTLHFSAAAWLHCTFRRLASTVAMVILSSIVKMPICTILTYLSSCSCIPLIPYSLPHLALHISRTLRPAMAAGSFITMKVAFISTLPTYNPSSSSFSRQYVSSASRVIVSLLLLMMMPMSTSFTCPTNCSTISPLPYPFGAHPGCGAPGFLLTNCSFPTPPLWNLTVAGTAHPYYIKSINPLQPISSNPKPSDIPNYGYGGTVQLYLFPSTEVPPFCASVFSPLNHFATSNFYAFTDPKANLTYYQDSYLFFNCSASLSSSPDLGVTIRSSLSCSKYLSHCNLSTTGYCFEYIPYKELQLATLMSTYNCSSFRRFLIANATEPVSAWVEATQFAWGQVQYADRCSSCQGSGGACGYDTEDNSFQCYCGDEICPINCHQGSGWGKSIGVGVGVGISVAAVFLLVFLGTAYYYRHDWYYCIMLRKERLNLDGVNQAPLELPYVALAAATKSFSTKIGRGAFGHVYRGMLFDGNEVAVKVLDASVSHTDCQFMNEVATIGNIHHVNVARLVGFCFRKSKRILVYEYVSNGSLDKYLFPGKQSSSEVVLTWKQRFDIALGIARGLCYMHEDCRSCIIHCDIKPENILLDAAFCPKIADFGLARLLTREQSRVLTQARGTPGYVAPEFWTLGSGPLTAKFDVYSYGIVLLDIIQGTRGGNEYEKFYLEETDADGGNAWMSVSVDKRIEHEVDIEQVKLCTLVALWCIQDNPNARPAMSKVVQYLQGAAPVPDNPPKPFRNIFKEEDSSQSHANSSNFLLSLSDNVFSLTLPRD